MEQNKFKEIELKIKAYICGKTLEILDYDTRDHIDENDREYYTGVTLPYIWNYVLEKQYSKKEVAYVLIKLIELRNIQFFYCSTPKRIIFEHPTTGHGTWDFDYIFKAHTTVNKLDDHDEKCSSMIMLRFLEISYNKYK